VPKEQADMELKALSSATTDAVTDTVQAVSCERPTYNF